MESRNDFNFRKYVQNTTILILADKSTGILFTTNEFFLKDLLSVMMLVYVQYNFQEYIRLKTPYSVVFYGFLSS